MSALLVAENEHTHRVHQGRTTSSMATSKHSQGPGSAMYLRTNSSPGGNNEDTRSDIQRRYSSEGIYTTQQAISNVDNNNINTAVKRPEHDNVKLHANRNENSVSGKNSLSDKATSQRHSHQAGILSKNIPPSAPAKDKQGPSGIDSLSKIENGIVVATLKAVNGEEFVLSAESIQTIICVTRVLVSELGAKIEKLEAFPKDGAESKPSDVKREESSSAPGRLESIEGAKYSKEELLSMSRSLLSKQPPESWRLLSQALPEVCLPANSVRHYFDPIDLHPHDSSLFIDSSNLKDRRDQRRL
ncbi:hypothetical protein EGW08_003302 [Elysia chlorotica]|uniref:Uncharacterized protein n=1 Tax=Elysia chlorotica TaxID=188477 RepID=A0A3S1ADA2_ELYCH|nr:hypothetical protein EGW08_003302 [Elysia chlorotica]